MVQLYRLTSRAAGFLFLLLFVFTVSAPLQARVLYRSDLITAQSNNRKVSIDVEVGDAENLYLVVTNGDGSAAYDSVAWINPRFVSADGETTSLTELEWEKATEGWGKTRVNKDVDGNDLYVSDKHVRKGIGTHAQSLIIYSVPDGVKRFRAEAALLDAAVRDTAARSGSVRFLVATKNPFNNLPETERRKLKTHEDLQVQLFASEPMLYSPSGIDIDSNGRVWVCEIINYRDNEGANRKEGDRILVLKDTDGDAKADEKTVFYQGTDVNSPHGIAVLEDPDSDQIRVIVSSAPEEPGPNVMEITDSDGDLAWDEKETIFTTGPEGGQHDHSIHSFVSGPDGHLYFNFGNQGKHLKRPDGETVVDQAGHQIKDDGEPYREGMVLRTTRDFSSVETLGWNFRNNWMVTVDSFGRMWQSDNDDDGNRGVRINYVMPYGNFGYKDEITGAGWRKDRTGMAEDISSRHWHQNDPGVVPNLLQTGPGSPAGITVYEGTLLPEVFRNELIHTDAGPGVVRSYPVNPDGAGFSTDVVPLLNRGRDHWFRPVDVKVAPDGSLIVADWYDPGVGGHNAGSLKTGRLFRLTTEEHDEYNVPDLHVSSVEDAISTLKNPNYAARYSARVKLFRAGDAAVPKLKTMWNSSNTRNRARALWILGKIPGSDGQKWVKKAIRDDNPLIRSTGLRLARQIDVDVLPLIRQLVEDPSPQVRRTCAVSLRGRTGKTANKLWARLAEQHEHPDRWYLEALGIGARNCWKQRFQSWLDRVGDDWNTPDGRDVVWRSRAPETPDYLADIILDPSTPREQLPRYFRAFHFQSDPQRRNALEKILSGATFKNEKRTYYVTSQALTRTRSESLSADRRQMVEDLLEKKRGKDMYLTLIKKFDLTSRHPSLIQEIVNQPDSEYAKDVAQYLLNNQKSLISSYVLSGEAGNVVPVIQALGNTRSQKVVDLLTEVFRDREAIEIREAVVRALARTKKGATWLIEAARNEQLGNVKQTAASVLSSVRWSKIREAAEKHLSTGDSDQEEQDKLPPIKTLVEREGDPSRGKKVFRKATCHTCHRINKKGVDFGPPLTEIGGKLTEKKLYEAILHPSEGILMGYEGWTLELADGTTVTGIINSETEEKVTVSMPGGVTRTYEKARVEQREQLSSSLMPEGLEQMISEQELVDLVTYLNSLE